MTIYDLIKEIKYLNPNILMNLDNISVNSNAENELFCDVNPEKLRLPEGFYYNEKNGITNKHNTYTGEYLSIAVKPLEKITKPYYNWMRTPVMVKDNGTDIGFYELINKITALNPGVNITVNDPMFNTDAYDRVYCSVDVKSLKLPEGFYYNDKNGITNKHNSNGSYLTIEFSNKIDEIDVPMSPQKFYNNSIREMVKEDDTKDYDLFSLRKALVDLNQGLTFDIGKPNVVSNWDSTLFCDLKDVKNLKLPDGFVYDKVKNRITNKHTTKTGSYLSIDLEDRTEQLIPKSGAATFASAIFMSESQIEKQYAKSPRLKDLYSSLILTHSKSQTSPQTFYDAIAKLNPNKDITFGKDDNTEMFIKSKSEKSLKSKIQNLLDFVLRKPQELVLPDGYERVSKNEVVNTFTGQTFSLTRLTMLNQNMAYSKKELSEIGLNKVNNNSINL